MGLAYGVKVPSSYVTITPGPAIGGGEAIVDLFIVAVGGQTAVV